jgi:hypothetical protein
MEFSKKSRANPKQRWHPDFRILEALPDNKVVRTKFLVHAAATALLVVAMSFAVSREFVKMGMKGEIGKLKAEQRSLEVNNQELTRQNAEFKALAVRLGEVRKFKKQPLHPSALLLAVSEIRTENLIFDSLSYQQVFELGEKQEVFKLIIAGKSKTTADIGDLKAKLAALEVSNGYSAQVVEIGNPSKDATTGIFSFQIEIRLKAIHGAK